ncbi:hypothetical protein BVX97_00560 [bacterium E08(2017)]|nr:hypothetical protein BVX97_00560 [bacterium E08(2017)]
MNSAKLKKDFLNQLHSPQQLELLFEYLPDVYFFAKDTDGRFVMANDIFVRKCGASSESEIIGKTDHDIFPLERADYYRSDDLEVMRTGRSIVNKVELAPERDLSINWFVTSKVPLYSSNNKVIGVAGTSRDIRMASLTLKPYNEMSEVVRYINEKYHTQIEISELASLVNLSVSQFERKFKKIFQMSPIKHIMNVRLKAACAQLADTDKTISTIALETGFYDHSHLTRQFRSFMKMSPSQYRKTYGK